MKQLCVILSILLPVACSSFSEAQDKGFPTDEQLAELYKVRAFALEEAKAIKQIADTKQQLIASFETAGGDEAEKKKVLDGLDATLEKVLSKDPKIRNYQLGTAQDLKSAMQLRMYWALQRNMDQLAKANAHIYPDNAALKLALKDDVDEQAVATLLKMYQRFRPEDEDDKRGWASQIEFHRDQKDIRVFEASTEEIGTRSTAAARGFPNGAVDAAKTILRPKTKFYRVEFVAPGKEAGVSYHLFYWGGLDWKMLGPVWRADRSGEEPSKPE